MNAVLGLRTFCVSVLLLALLSPSVEGVEKQKVILDTDMGQLNDDAYALFMLANSPEIDLLGVTTCTGNVWGEQAVAFSLRHLEMVGRPQVPVLRGTAEQRDHDRPRDADRLRLAVRNGYLNFYRGGQSVARVSVTASGRKLQARAAAYQATPAHPWYSRLLCACRCSFVA